MRRNLLRFTGVIICAPFVLIAVVAGLVMI